MVFYCRSLTSIVFHDHHFSIHSPHNWCSITLTFKNSHYFFSCRHCLVLRIYGKACVVIVAWLRLIEAARLAVVIRYTILTETAVLCLVLHFLCAMHTQHVQSPTQMCTVQFRSSRPETAFGFRLVGTERIRNVNVLLSCTEHCFFVLTTVNTLFCVYVLISCVCV